MSADHSILIKNLRVVDPYQGYDQTGDLVLQNGRILANPKESTDLNQISFQEEIDAKGLIALPSLVDTNVHLREPGFERKASIQSELKAAAASGIGHLACVPSCEPTIDTASLAKSIIHKSQSFALSDVYPIGALTHGLKGSQLSEMKSLFDAGCVALTNYYHPFDNLNVIRRCYEYAATYDIPVFIYPQVSDLAKNAIAHEGYWSSKLGLPGIPESAETIALATHLILIEQCGVRAHFSQLSSAKSVEQIAEAKSKGLNVSADVTAHQLFLNDACLESYNSNFNVLPPLRTEQDAKALIEGLRIGTIDAICSSHQPHEAAAKNLPFEAAEPGISALESLLPLAGKLSDENFGWTQISKLICQNPAEILGITRQGFKVGEQADFCLIRHESPYTFDANKLISSGKNTAFDGQTFSTQVVRTFLKGIEVFKA